MRSLGIDNEPRALGKPELESDETFVAYLGFSGIFGDELATEAQRHTPQKSLKDEQKALRQQDRLILSELWNGLILGLVTYGQIQDFTGKSLFELEYLATVEPGCLRGFFVATQAEAPVDYFVPTRAKA